MGIKAAGGNHDGNAQIDAIIAANLPNVKKTGFKVKDGDSTHRTVQVDYEVEYEGLSSLQVGIYTSPDGAAKGTLLRTVTITNPAKLSVGNHSVELTDIFSGFTDPQEDYRLIAVLDPDDSIQEFDEQDNIIVFSGGLLFDASSQIVHFHGTDDHDEFILINDSEVGAQFKIKRFGVYSTHSIENNISEIHVRLHDAFDGAYGGRLWKSGEWHPLKTNVGFCG